MKLNCTKQRHFYIPKFYSNFRTSTYSVIGSSTFFSTSCGKEYMPASYLLN